MLTFHMASFAVDFENLEKHILGHIGHCAIVQAAPCICSERCGLKTAHSHVQQHCTALEHSADSNMPSLEKHPFGCERHAAAEADTAPFNIHGNNCLPRTLNDLLNLTTPATNHDMRSK